MVSCKAAAEGKIAQQLRINRGGDLLCLIEKNLAGAAGEVTDFFKGRFERDASLAGIADGLNAGKAHPLYRTDQRRAAFGLLSRLHQEIAGHSSSLALDNSAALRK